MFPRGILVAELLSLWTEARNRVAETDPLYVQFSYAIKVLEQTYSARELEGGWSVRKTDTEIEQDWKIHAV